jgi:Galactosyltransferase
MNEGKSQTWFKYAYNIMQEYPEISYVMKIDTDAILHLHEFFHFAYRHLPPPPYSGNAYVGALRDKAFWPSKKGISDIERETSEGFFGTEFGGVHLYLAGQCYILSTNLARVVMAESQLLHEKPQTIDKTEEIKSNHTTYLEGHEDHDIAAMIFRSPEPVHLITIGRKQRFWEHPVKGQPRWRRIWLREVARMEGRPFENRLYSMDSSFEEVMGFRIGVAE